MITYFVLKADGGRSAGCVRLENGQARSSCPCTLLLEDGVALDIGLEETPLPARPLGAAVLQGEKLAAWGTVPGATLTKGELLHRLRQARTAAAVPQPNPGPGPEPEPGPVPEPEPEPEPIPEPTPEPKPVSAPEPTPETEPMPKPEPSPDPLPGPESDPVPEPADSAALAADFGLLVKHAGEVYDGILRPPLPDMPEAEEPAEKEGSQGNWFAETDELLSRLQRQG